MSLSKILLVMSLILSCHIVVADIITRELGIENGEPEAYVFPYGFASESMGYVVGAAGGISGFPQEQNSLVTTALVSTEGAMALYAFFNDYQFSEHKHLFLDMSVGLGKFPQQRAYVDAIDSANQPSAGSNDSSENNFFYADGLSNWIEVDFKYVLNIGNGKYNPVNIYTLSEGLLVGGASGGEIFNPFKSGRTYIQASFFHHNRDYDVDTSSPLSTTGIAVSAKYDNTDFPVSPSKGSIIDVGLKYDLGLGRNREWLVGEIEYSKFVKLPVNDFIEQQVLAFNAWTASTFSDERPPYYYGVTLGGLYRLRAYPIERFHDDSAVYYSTEYRVIPASDLLRKLTFLEFAGLQWWEIAVFYEIGRVAPSWDIAELHRDMKSDMGLSLRVMASNNIGRLDFAWSDEDAAVWLMYGRPF
ncbi:hypothetical protein MNBD_GAMMA09-836 [hydrothermal vent metagenome]|uniref:Bacterial surface antigen (D15) domain-containing protein n=1 Tax=hydrothermal vent metagenome TaxID=652676 RepID=A0A3B0Y510_9ZZZZ